MTINQSYYEAEAAREADRAEKDWALIASQLPEGMQLVHVNACVANIVACNGEKVGSIGFRRSGSSYSYRPKSYNAYRLESPRIPNRQSWRTTGGNRTFKRLDSLMAAVHEFCKPVTSTEADLKALNKKYTGFCSRVQNRCKGKYNVSESLLRRAAFVAADPSTAENGMMMFREQVWNQRRLNVYTRRTQVIQSKYRELMRELEAKQREGK